MLFCFVRMEFTSSLGPAPGRYPVAAADPQAGGDDALVIAVTGGPPPRQRLLRRARRVSEPGPVREVPLLRVTWVRTSAPLDGKRDARRLLGDLRVEAAREALIDHALGTVNRAIRGYAAAAADPYAQEISRSDPRDVHVGVGTGQEIDAGTWSDALSCPLPARGRVRTEGRVRLDLAVTAALTAYAPPLDAELHLLRALLDLEHGRTPLAAHELAAAAARLAEERASLDEAAAPEVLDPLLERLRAVQGDGTAVEDAAAAARELLEGLVQVREAAWLARDAAPATPAPVADQE